MPGSIAKNAQEGTRSEYLAQYALSLFGTAVPVPHPEDSGIDLYCTLGRRLGRRFLVENQYFVQVKSVKDPITYDGEDEVNWLLSHNYPFLICIVNKTKLSIDIYHTLALSTLIGKVGINKVTLTFDVLESKDYFPQLIEPPNLEVHLGEPIVSFDVGTLACREINTSIAATLKSWVELDQENISLKETGFTTYRVPASWTTNKPVEA